MTWDQPSYNRPSSLERIGYRSSPTPSASHESSDLIDRSDSSQAVTEKDASHDHSPTPKNTEGRVAAWRVGARVAVGGVFITLIFNVALAIAIPKLKGGANGTFSVYVGDCNKTKTINTWIHLVINLFSTLLLCGSNYCMQCLSAPTRADVDKAHANGKWLDIGVPSVRNLRAIGFKKSITWWALGLSSVPLHLMYNSIFFASISAYSYTAFAVSKGFPAGAPYDEKSWGYYFDGDYESATFENLTNVECIAAYSNEFITNRRDVFLVMDSQSDDSVYVTVEGGGAPDDTEFDPYFWICPEDVDLCRRQAPTILEKVKNGGDWQPGIYPENVKYCLSETMPETCSLYFNQTLTIVIIVCNVGKLIAMGFVALWLRSSEPLLITIGDAIHSFTARHDPHTTGMCLLPRGKFLRPGEFSQPVTFRRRRRRWGEAPSLALWCTVLALFAVAILTIIGLLVYGIHQIKSSVGSDAKSLWNLGFGSVQVSTIIYGWDLYKAGHLFLVAAVLIANLPQTILSFLYLLLNRLCTNMLLAREWGSYSSATTTTPKPLRVSEPRGNYQRSTYFLQVPYRYGIPLILMSAILHWGVSQSLFLAVIITDRADFTISCGYSPPAIIFTLIVGTLLLFFAIGFGFRKLEEDIPLASSSSAAIAATCHGGKDDDSKLPLQWGAVDFGSEEGDVGHCCFSSREVTAPVEGRLYAGIKIREKDKTV